jgi:hypothetical protein
VRQDEEQVGSEPFSECGLVRGEADHPALSPYLGVDPESLPVSSLPANHESLIPNTVAVAGSPDTWQIESVIVPGIQTFGRDAKDSRRSRD